jgi:sialidase-1
MNNYKFLIAALLLVFSCDESDPPLGKGGKSGEKTNTGAFVAEVKSPDIFVGDKGQDKSKYHTFRIPAIVKSKEGTLLAFCEGRKDRGGDMGNIDMMLRRSPDGVNWSPMIKIWDDGNNTCGNPCPAVDPETGRIHLLMTWTFGTDRTVGDFNTGKSTDTRRPYYTYSDDDGKTWSKPVEITSQAKKTEWGFFATGPCHGIVLSNGVHKGRLLFPCDAMEIKSITGSTTGYSLVVYSDDQGKTWHIGGTVKGGNECCAAELEDGRIILTCRAAGGKRLLAWSSDGGETFTTGTSVAALPDPKCQGCILSTTFNGKDVLLHSNCADASERIKMTVKGSSDGGQNWNSGYLVSAPHVAYSDMVMLDNNILLLLYENGESSSYEKISVQKIAISYILK